MYSGSRCPACASRPAASMSPAPRRRPADPRPRDHRGLRYRRMAEQHGLDLARLDPETADLHLVVGPAQEHDLRRPGSTWRQVAGAVHPRRRRTGRPRTAARSDPAGPDSRGPHPAPATYSSPATPDRHRRQGRRPARRAGCWRSADRSAGARRSVHVSAGGGHTDRGLGRPVVVEDPPAIRDQRPRNHSIGAPHHRGPSTGAARCPARADSGGQRATAPPSSDRSGARPGSRRPRPGRSTASSGSDVQRHRRWPG